MDPRGSLKNGPSTEFAGSPVAVHVHVGCGAHKTPENRPEDKRHGADKQVVSSGCGGISRSQIDKT